MRDQTQGGEFNREWDHFSLMCLMLQLSLLAASLIVGVLLPIACVAAGVVGTLFPFYVAESISLLAGLLIGAFCYQVHLWHKDRFTFRRSARHTDQHRWTPVVHRPNKTVNLASSVGRSAMRR